ncbi:MAG: 2OG-Fe(II) oxygenase family protein [Luminiphilus sp.]|jgi:isopenicillin N synthase-like dioxygenase
MELSQLSFRHPQFDLQLASSLHQFGFAIVVDHPLDLGRVQRIYRQWQDFFNQGLATQYLADGSDQDGYYALDLAERAKGYTQRDYKEYFQFYSWGRCPESLRGDLSAYFDEATALGAIFLDHIALNLPAKVTASLSEPLQSMISGSRQSMLRVTHYPPLREGRAALRAAPHEDINLLTLLPAADGPGLELKLRSGEWIEVPQRREQLIVNVGDMLQEATAGYLPSATHRVVASATHQRRQSRMSMPLFLHPRPEVVLSQRYTAEGYLAQRLCELGVA